MADALNFKSDLDLFQLKISAPCFLSTGNPGKLRELIPMVKQYFPWMTPLCGRAALVAEETASDYLGNALIKAKALANEIAQDPLPPQSYYVLADDSGLSVDALHGAPGVFSARYAGDHVENSQHIAKLLKELSNVPQAQRTGRYHCALALVWVPAPGKQHFLLSEGTCEGLIADSPHGNSGFGYDPVFLDPQSGRCFAEMSYEEKNAHSHRQHAFEKLHEKISP